MNSNSMPVLYLFENVFYPETIIPLVLTDEPSKFLIREAYKNDQMVALYSTHPKSKGVATAGKILLLEDKAEDGKLTAVIHGLTRIKLTQLVQHIPYPLYEFKNYSDEKEPHVLKEGSLKRLFEIFDKWLSRHVKNEKEREVFLKEVDTPKKLVYNISLFMIKDLELKIIFLESTSIADRINILDALLAGEKPESEDKNIAEAIKNFESLDANYFKNAAN